MSINGRGEISSASGEAGPDGGFLAFLRAVALVAAVAGAAGSVGLMFYVGHRSVSRFLLTFFAIWVLSPFTALELANVPAKRWSILTRAALYCLTIIITIGSLAIYQNVLSMPPGSRLAPPFLLVPLASWLLVAVAIPLAMIISGRISKLRPVAWLVKTLAAVALMSVVGIAVLLGLLWLDHNQDTILPVPTGLFAVGRMTYAWSDAAYTDPLATPPGTKRQ